MLICEGAVARIQGAGTVEEAEPLLAFLLGGADRAVDLGACTSLHLALVQVLRAAHPRLVVGPADAALARWIEPPPTPPAGAGETP
jgi:hypothetical protein